MITAKDVLYPAKFSILTMCELKLKGMKRGRILNRGIYVERSVEDFPSNDGVNLNKNFELLTDLKPSEETEETTEEIEVVETETEEELEEKEEELIEEDASEPIEVLPGYTQKAINRMKRKMYKAGFLEKRQRKNETIIKKYKEFKAAGKPGLFKN